MPVTGVKAQLPALQVTALGFNLAVLLMLPILFGSKPAAINERLNAKRERVTTLHCSISSNCVPSVIDRGTGTIAQGRFRRASTNRP